MELSARSISKLLNDIFYSKKQQKQNLVQRNYFPLELHWLALFFSSRQENVSGRLIKKRHRQSVSLLGSIVKAQTGSTEKHIIKSYLNLDLINGFWVFNSILIDSKQGVKFDQNRYTNQTCNSDPLTRWNLLQNFVFSKLIEWYRIFGPKLNKEI